MNTPILVLDDDEAMGAYLVEALLPWGFHATATASVDDALVTLDAGEFQAVVTDVQMKGRDGFEFTRLLGRSRPDLPVIVVTAFGSIQLAVDAMRLGAYDFLPKPFEVEVLALTLRRALEHRGLAKEVQRLRELIEEERFEDGLIGLSGAMRAVFSLIDRLSDSDASIVIQGETGTGKELVARAIHRKSPFADGPFVALNCAAMPGDLLESELFGHEKGAFTGAVRRKDGLFLQADGGSLFLDEIGELSSDLQPKLLRVLQERRLRRVGGTEEIPFGTRIIAATHRDLGDEAGEDSFRRDLYFRLAVLQVTLPPLRERGADIYLLAEHFLSRNSQAIRKGVQGFTSDAKQRLLDYLWPGNVRELQNCIERAVALADTEAIRVQDLPDRIQEQAPDRIVLPLGPAEEFLSMSEIEQQYIRRVMAATGGNKTRAARVLGFDRKTLYRKLERYGILPTAGVWCPSP
jgi:two-component system response regulator HydG